MKGCFMLPSLAAMGYDVEAGRRPPQRVDSLVMPASENLHNRRDIPRLGLI